MVVCLSCGTSNPDGFRFCGACAAPLGLPGAGPREERRTVTVLFADLAGFTSRSETLDPEDVRAFLVPYYDALTTEITGHGGRVDRFLGDGIMALFGAPVAHEDDPERAVRAALRIVERVPGLGLDLHVRVGINTGPVLFVAADGDRDDAVTGDSVNTAARLQAAAPTDGVVVGEATYRATSHLFRYEALDPIRAKGKAELVPLWRPLERVAHRAGELMAETTPFVGRAFELETLVRLFERACSTPSLEVVTIVADPGIGKSRLVRELARHVDALPDLVTWRVGRCLPYGDGISFWALGEIIKAHAGILDTDDQVTLSSKLDTVLTEPDLQLRAWIKDRLAPLVGLETSTAPPQQEEVFTAWRRFLESIAQAGPTVLIIEDLHWADDTLVAFLGHVAANTAGLPILLVATARPEIEERHPTWLGRARRSTVLSLAALADPDMAELVEATLPGASPELVATVLDRAAGSPLYAEQLAAMFRDRLLPVAGGSLDEAAIPPTIAALLAARIDALPPEAKAVLLDASVVGKTFWSGAVAALAERDRGEVEPLLAELSRRELVRPAFPSSMVDEAEYTFVHALVRDVAYGELPRAARLARHRATAAWITDRAGRALGEEAEIVHAHLERALGLAKAVGAFGELPAIEASLVDALISAAETALRTDVPRGIACLRRTLEMLPDTDPRRAEVLAKLGLGLSATADYREAAGVLEAAAETYRASGRDVAAAGLGSALSVALAYAGEGQRGKDVLLTAHAMLRDHPGPELVAVLSELAFRRLVEGDRAAAELADRAIDLAASLGHAPPARALMTRAAFRYGRTPDTLGAEADMRVAVDTALAAGDLRTAAVGMYNLAESRGDVHGAASAIVAFDEAVAFSATIGLPTEPPRIYQLDRLVDVGRWEEALREAESLRAWAQAHGDRASLATIDWVVARVCLERGEAIGSRTELEASARVMGTFGYPYWWMGAEVALAHGDIETARALLAEALDTFGDDNVWSPVPFVRACIRAGASELARRALLQGVSPEYAASLPMARTMLAEVDGDLRVAHDGYERASDVSADRGELPEHAYALAGLGRCLLALGKTGDGIVRLRESREIWERLQATPRIAEIDAALAAAGAASGPDPELA